MLNESAVMLFIKNNPIIVSFLGGFITGETFILALAFISASGTIPVGHLLFFGTLGMFLSDFIPFTIGKFRFLRRILEREKWIRRIESMEYHLEKYTRKNLFLMLIYTKFIYGASIPALIYLGHKKVSYSKFAIYNLIVEIIFVPLVILIGWLGGKGFTGLVVVFKDIRIGMFFLILFVIIIWIIRKWINQRLIKELVQ